VLVKSEVVTAVPWRAKVLAVTVPEMAGREPMVTELPIVTDAIETGWVAGKLEMVTAEKVTACDAGKLLMETVPLIEAVTEPICAVPAPMVTVPAPIVTTPIRFVPAGRAEPMVTVPETLTGKSFTLSEPATITPLPPAVY